MINEPPIDKLIAKVGCHYAVSCLVAKRARQIAADTPADPMNPPKIKPITQAAAEVYEGKVTFTNE